MATQTINATMQVKVDSTQAKNALKDFTREMQAAITSLTKAGQQASKTFGSIGQAAADAGSKIESATQKALRLLDQQTASVSKSTDGLGKMRAQEAEAAKSKDKGGKVGTGKEDGDPDSLSGALAKEEEYYRGRNELQSQWLLGLRRGLVTYASESSKTYDTLKKSSSEFLTGFDKQIEQLVRTGKANFSDISKTFLTDFGKVSLRELVTKPGAGLFADLLGDVFGRAPAEDKKREGGKTKVAAQPIAPGISQEAGEAAAATQAGQDPQPDESRRARQPGIRWASDAQRALRDFGAAAGDTFDIAKEAGQRWITGFGEQLETLVFTGKANFKDLADSILIDLARIAARKALIEPLAGALSQGFGALSGMFAGGGIGSATAADVAAAGEGLMFLGGGGYTGDRPRDQVAGVVHGQEYVLNADATARIGRGTLDAMNSGSRNWMGGDGSSLPTGTPAQAGTISPTGGSVINVGVTINGGGDVQSSAPEDYEQFAQEVGTMIDARFQQLQARSYRQGGMAWQQQNGRM
ncbi:phage tail tape measure C-terminal domain-containing protein [Bordetella genomosp. 13]|uniref:phage tail tape measure C-terminal domain-containing protein n=1 Tax=Bordetella genomosp. 13 TaxID=463040 RepID=UPI0011A37D25|nr:phage tail tape measure C-terminal domain-containing protein [Bordetella genomosp. 13]